MLSADCNKGWSGLELQLCSSRGCVVSCCWGVVCPFVLVNLETDRRELGATEESELGSSPVAGRGGEAGIFCAGEEMPGVHGLCCSRLKAIVYGKVGMQAASAV
jgi:hypothetical protein